MAGNVQSGARPLTRTQAKRAADAFRRKETKRINRLIQSIKDLPQPDSLKATWNGGGLNEQRRKGLK